jgi:hypothetical protein
MYNPPTIGYFTYVQNEFSSDSFLGLRSNFDFNVCVLDCKYLLVFVLRDTQSISASHLAICGLDLFRALGSTCSQYIRRHGCMEFYLCCN